jgi:predicted NACHT family NTPase
MTYVKGRLFNGNYQVEPSDILKIIEREKGNIYRMVSRDNKSLSLDDLHKEAVDADCFGFIILGEAGIGKTTTCKYLSRKMVNSLFSMSEKKKYYPFFVPLGNWNIDQTQEIEINDFGVFLNSCIVNFDGMFDELASSAKDQGYRLLIFLDGLNEQSEKPLQFVKAYFEKLKQRFPKNLFFISTTRPVTATNFWPEKDFRIFKIQRWNDDQIF